MNVRLRSPADLAACVDALAEVHEVDGYPARWPADPVTWLDPPNTLRAWVVVRGEDVVAHVVVRAEAHDPVLTAVTGRPTGQLASISRLFVIPGARGTGLSRALLTEAGAFAARTSLGLILDVLDDAADAIAVYEHLGWRLIDRHPAPWTTGYGDHPVVRRYVQP